MAVGIDPGSKKEAYTVKSEKHTLLNIQADAVTWVKAHLEIRRTMRRSRRNRKTPYRKNRSNRNINKVWMSPATRARWGWKLRLCQWLARYYPITAFSVEDIKAKTQQGKQRWNKNFSPLEVGKKWFYQELGKLVISDSGVITWQGWETYNLREALGLKKSKDKLSDKFEAHCVDSWVLAAATVGGHSEPENKQLLYIVPLRFHRRQLHRLQPEKGGIRKPYGGTLSFGFKRGSWVNHPKYGICYLGGQTGKVISLHSLQTGERITKVNPNSIKFLTTASWRIRKEFAASSLR